MQTHTLILLLGAALAGGALPAQESNPGTEMWADPVFIRSFTGSYGFLAGYEPRISEEEKVALRSLIDLIKASPTVAIQQIEAQIQPDTSAAFDFILANLHFQEGNLARAERSYGDAIKKHPEFRRAYKNLGLVQVQSGDFDAAIETISKAMELGEVDGRAYGLLGYGYLTQQRYYPAEIAYRQAILMQPEVTDWKVGLARCLLETQRYADAIALFDFLLQDNPDHGDTWLLQANAFIGNGQPLLAARNIEVARRMGAVDLATLTLLGDIYMNSDSPDLALDAYLAATDQAGEEDADALVRAADLLSNSGNQDHAKAMVERTRARFNGKLQEHNDLKLLTLEAKMARAAGDDEAAATSLHAIVERDGLNGDAIIELANHYADEGDLPRAINRYEQAEKIPAYERAALIAHAQLLVRNSDYKSALPLLRRALQLKPDDNLEKYAERVEGAARREG